MIRTRAIPVETLALAFELRQEYKWRWKAIARELQLDPDKLCGAVNKALVRGLARG